jgi:zinc transport system ATP-binding protein
MPLTDPPLRLRGATFGYGDRIIVEGIDLTIEPGEVVAVLGANGSGKSTLLKGLVGLSDLRAGTVEVFGAPGGTQAARNRVGYVPQRHTLATSVRATAREIVATGTLPTRPRPLLRRRGVDRVVTAALCSVGLAEHADRDVGELSGGQQRRVLIARALAGAPEILLMDEPTAGVDVANQHVLAAVLRRLAATGVTLVVVTHELDALVDVVTRVLVVHGGRVSFDGSVANFLEQHDVVHHDHDSHHHDDELAPGTHPGAVPSGPFHQAMGGVDA